MDFRLSSFGAKKNRSFLATDMQTHSEESVPSSGNSAGPPYEHIISMTGVHNFACGNCYALVVTAVPGGRAEQAATHHGHLWVRDLAPH